MSTIIASSTLVQALEVDGVFEGAVFDESALGDVLVILGETHDEAEVRLGIRVEFADAELDDVSHAFRGAMHTFYTIVCGGCADVGEFEVDFVGYAHHDR